MIKHFVDPAGNYYGAFDGAPPPADAIEVVTPPEHASQTWNGVAWVDTAKTVTRRDAEKEAVTLPELLEVLKAKGIVTAADLRGKVQGRP